MQEVLYRFFDSERTLLYVGISKNWIMRFRDHSKSSDFFSAVAEITLERYPDRESVAQAEIEAIEKENPIFNRADNPNYRTWQTHFRELLDMAKGRKKVDEIHRQLIDTLLRGARDCDDFGTGKWLSVHFPPEWYEQSTRYGFECDLCLAVATHPTIHAWRYEDEED